MKNMGFYTSHTVLITLEFHHLNCESIIMLHDVVSAIYQEGYLIELEFDDGRRGTVDFTKYVDRRGVFERFKDLQFFRNFTINKELGVLTWGNEIEIAPETLYAKATGTPLPS